MVVVLGTLLFSNVALAEDPYACVYVWGDTLEDVVTGQRYKCAKTSNEANGYITFPYAETCIYYTDVIRDAGSYKVLSDCYSDQSFTCFYDQKYDSLNQICENCPAGSFATDGEDYHLVETCDICDSDYYKDTGTNTCKSCPLGGFSDGMSTTTQITDCYLAAGYEEYNDTTGTYVYTRDCFYKE